MASGVLFLVECSHVSSMRTVLKVVVLEDIMISHTSNFGKCLL